MQERREAKQKTSTDRDEDREQQHDPIDRDLASARQAVGICGKQCLQASHTQSGAERTADEREYHAFRQELTQQPPAAGAERRADRELPLARLRACEHEVRQVGARNEQHETHRPLQNPERSPQAPDQIVLQPVEPETVPFEIRHVSASALGRPLLQHRLKIGPRLCEADAVLEPPDEVEEMTAAVTGVRGVERQRQPHLNSLVVNVEPRRHDSDDPRGRSVDGDCTADDGFVAVERRAPQLARENRDVLCLGQRVLACEVPSADRGHTEHGHQLRRDDRGVDAARLILRAEIHRAGAVPTDLLKGLVARGEFDELRRGDPELIEPETRELARDENQPLRLRVRQRLQHDSVDHAEDRGVRAYAERQREHRDRSVTRALPQTAERVEKILFHADSSYSFNPSSGSALTRPRRPFRRSSS